MKDKQNRNPFAEFLDQLEILLDTARKLETLPINEEDAKNASSKLETLKLMASRFTQLHREMLIQSGLTPKQIDESTISPPIHGSQKEKDLWEKARKMKLEAMILKSKYEQIAQEETKKTTSRDGVDADKQKKIKERKKKFKKLGGEGYIKS